MFAFIWMAITAYDVDKDEIVVFAWLSLLLIVLLIGAGLVVSFLLWFVRRSRNKDGLLGKIETIEKETADIKPEEKNS